MDPIGPSHIEWNERFLTLGILDVTSLRSTNYFTTVQAAVLASAFTYARSR
jgi:hypothetical protein